MLSRACSRTNTAGNNAPTAIRSAGRHRMWYRLTALLVLLILIPAILSVFSRFKQPETGIVSGCLRACPATPNCVSSEDSNSPSFARPISFHGPPEEAWKITVQVIREMGGRIVIDTGVYLHATFHSPLFRFIDDLELRTDSADRTIHFRSASRSGYSDLGINRKRIEELRQRIKQLMV